MNIALLTAVGNGTRMGQDIPKQFMPINNKPIIIYTLEKFQNHPAIGAILVAILPTWIEVLKSYALQFNLSKLGWVVQGGETNQASICNGLVEFEHYCFAGDVVMTHDGNRCMVSEEIISRWGWYNSRISCKFYVSPRRVA